MKVSIQIPVNTGATFLKEALDCIQRQTYHNYEVIVVDDGSGEDIAGMLKAYPDVIFSRQEHRGVAAARNRALELSSGDIIAFLDADDLWAEEKLQKQIHYLKEHPECEIIFSGTENFTEISQEAMTNRQKQLFHTKISTCMVSSCVRRGVFEKYGNYQEEQEYGEDTEIMARWAAAGISLEHCLEDSLYFRRIHTDNMSLLHNKVEKKEYLELLAAAFRRARKGTER